MNKIKVLKKIKKVLIIMTILIVFLIISFVRHKISLVIEENLRKPLGEMVEVDGHNMSIYVEGQGEHTLVFLAGGGTSSPILDFKSLYSLLNDEYRIVVIEKFGYGFSDVVDGSRNIDIILRQTREGLDKLGIEGPYILCPHSISGIEAIYWAQQYPEEVKGIIGLDMAVPQYYEEMKIPIPIMKAGQYGAELGIARWIPGLSDSDAIRHGTLTDDEKKIYKAVFYNRTATLNMINEAKAIKDNASIVETKGIPETPMLLFISNGSGGTGFEKEAWRRIPKEYISALNNAEYIELDCPHYVHNYMYVEISSLIKEYINHLEH